MLTRNFATGLIIMSLISSFTSFLYFTVHTHSLLYSPYCEAMEVDERYKVTLGGTRICPAANNQALVCVLRCHFLYRHQLCYIILVSGSLAQSGEHRNGNPTVVGSSPHENDFISRIEKPEAQH